MAELQRAPAPDNMWGEILNSPRFFLHGIDAGRKQLQFLETSREQLSKPSFIDGRVALSTSKILHELPIEEAFHWLETKGGQGPPDNFIFHMGFCGSTLMAKSLDKKGTSFSYKEPQALIHAAELDGLKGSNGDEYTDKIIGLVLAQFSIPWSSDERTIIKPSSWVNSLLPVIARREKSTNAVFISIEPKAFLIAVFRGGEPRVQYQINFLNHLLSAYPQYLGAAEKIAKDASSMVDSLVKLVLLSHILQERLFSTAATRLPDSSQFHCTYSQFTRNPQNVLMAASNIFDLGIDDPSMQKLVSDNFLQHSKTPERKYDQGDSDAVNRQVCDHYSRDFDAGLAWYRENSADMAKIS